MFTKLVSWLIVIGLINYTIGCTVQKTIKPSDDSADFITLKAQEDGLDTKYRIVSVILNNGEEIKFDAKGGYYKSETRTIDGYQITHTDQGARNNTFVKIKTQDIQSIRISEISAGQSIDLGIAVIVIIGVVAFLAFLLYLDASGGIMGHGGW